MLLQHKARALMRSQDFLSVMRKFGSDAHIYIPGAGLVTGANFVDSAGTTTASVDNPAGLSLDALQAMTLGSELAPALSAGNGWTTAAGWSLGENQVSATAAGAGSGTYKALGTTNGNTYQVTFTLSGYASGSCYATLFNGVNGPAISTNGTYTCTLTRNFVTDLAGVAATANFTGTISGLSIKPIPGIHATQATTANKPILRRGLLNRRTYSQDFSNAAWTSSNLNVTLGQASSPYGTNDSAFLAPTAVSGSHVLYQNDTTISQNVTMAFIAKAGVLQFLSPSNAGAGVLTSTFDLVSGTSANGASTTSSMVSLGGGWWLGAMSFTAAYTSASFYINNSSSASIGSFAGNGVDGLYLYRAGLFQGTLTAQQIIDAGGIPLTTTAAASNPSAGKYSWQFDSTDVLTATYPAGYESATIIDALKSGVVTNQGVNVVGAYSIGPSVNTAGRILLRTAPTAAQLLTLQRFAETWI